MGSVAGAEFRSEGGLLPRSSDPAPRDRCHADFPSPGERSLERRIGASYWVRLRRPEPVARDRFCRRVLAKVARLAAPAAEGNHARYLEVFRLTAGRDAELGDAFDGTRRSTAVVQLARMRSLGVVTDDEFVGFSAEARVAVGVFLELWRDEPDPGR